MERDTSVNKEWKNPSSCSSGRRSRHSSSTEFEFWMVRNPSFPQPHLISADELFFNGILRPLHLLPTKQPQENPPAPEPEPEPSPLIISDPTPAVSSSRRWRAIFKKEKSTNQQDKEKKKKKSQNQSRGCPAELNMIIWPFSRSRTAGTSGTRTRMAASTAGARKVSSAPCSRESKSRKGPSSPSRSRAGVQLGRSNPVWQVRRSGTGSAVNNLDAMARTTDKCSAKKQVTETRPNKTGNGGNNNNKANVLHLNVPMRIGYKHLLNCRTHHNNTDRSGCSCGNGRISGIGA